MSIGPNPEQQSIIRKEVLNPTEWRPIFDRNAQELLSERYFLAVDNGEIFGEKSLVSDSTRAHTKNLLEISVLPENEGIDNLAERLNDQALLDAVYMTLSWRKDTIRELLNQELQINLPQSISTLDLIIASTITGQKDVVQFAITQARRELMIQKLGRNYIMVRNSLDTSGRIIPERKDDIELAELTHTPILTRTFQDYKDIIISLKNTISLDMSKDKNRQLISSLHQNLPIDFGSDINKASELALLTFIYICKLANGDRNIFASLAQRLGIPKPPEGVQIENPDYSQILNAAPYIATYFSGMNYSHLKRKIK